VRRDLFEIPLRIAMLRLLVLIRVKLFLRAIFEIHHGVRGAFPFNYQMAN
jgi:hypothetical protein